MKTYSQSGVDISAGDEFVKNIKNKVKSTFSKSVLSDIGNFAALFDAKFPQKKEPVLVSSVDGVGTKLKVAFLMGKHDTIGQDLVNHCVNDIAVIGAEPLFFLDYIATGKLKPHVAEAVIEGIVKACKKNKCSLIGGETAEMPSFYRNDEYDLAGMVVGVVEKKKILGEKSVNIGDLLVALPSSGLHTNGYSLARNVLFERYEADDFIVELGMRLGDALLIVHKSYLNVINVIKNLDAVHSIAHITGGGIVGNIVRIIPKGCNLKINWESWKRPAIFQLIQKCGDVPESEMRKTFNLGVGLVIVCSKVGIDKIIRILRRKGERPLIIGEIV